MNLALARRFPGIEGRGSWLYYLTLARVILLGSAAKATSENIHPQPKPKLPSPRLFCFVLTGARYPPITIRAAGSSSLYYLPRASLALPCLAAGQVSLPTSDTYLATYIHIATCICTDALTVFLYN